MFLPSSSSFCIIGLSASVFVKVVFFVSGCDSVVSVSSCLTFVNSVMMALLLILESLVLVSGDDSVELLLGVIGGVTKRTYQFHLLVAAWDLDFRKNHYFALRDRLGPPVVEVAGLPPHLRIRPMVSNTDGKAELAISAGLDLILGRRNYSRIHGLVGGHYSSESMPLGAKYLDT